MGHATADDDGAADADPTAEASPPRSTRLADPERAAFLHASSRPGPGQYGEGDVFIGVRVPATRTIVHGSSGLPQHEAARSSRARCTSTGSPRCS